MKPLLRRSPLGSVYVITRYTQKKDYLLAHCKYDVTADFMAIMNAWPRKKRKETKRER